jgi:predicted ArsR family transcriptional regulator
MKPELISVADAARKLKVKEADVYRALRPLVAAGLIAPHAGFSGGGRPTRLLDEAAVALLRKALKVGVKA